MEEIEWKCTNSDTQQYGRRLSTYVFDFYEGDLDAEPCTFKQSKINLEDYTWKEICDACEKYYDNMDELFAIYGSESCWIIAECLFEQLN